MYPRLWVTIGGPNNRFVPVSLNFFFFNEVDEKFGNRGDAGGDGVNKNDDPMSDKLCRSNVEYFFILRFSEKF